MSKKVRIILACVLSLALVGVLIAHLIIQGQANLPKITILDSKGNILIQTNKKSQLYKDENAAYLDIAFNEAAAALAEKNKIDIKKAEKLLFKGEHTIHTAFDSSAFASLFSACNLKDNDFSTAAALCDHKGNLIAAYGYYKEGNLSTKETAPYSALKPLSVYAPAIDAGLINWTSQYEDSPYKKIEDEKGVLQNWPANHTGTYAMKNTTVCDAISASLNTVAVKCLKDLGVQNSLAFLQKKLNIPLEEEAYVIQKYGEEEVLSSLALGYLEKGVSPVNMAGYYTIFATGGSYTEPKAVLKITDSQNSVVYKRQESKTQVISPESADIMNKLLQNVVKIGGTGEQINLQGVEVAGKTGTGDGNEANWFVGITPTYSLAVWHSQNENNKADEIFSAAMEGIYFSNPSLNKRFVTHKNLKMMVYCADSGMAISQNCSLVKMGYFSQKENLALCNIH